MLREVDLAGHDYLRTVTELLLAARGDDPLAGLYEAGDLQWWWKDEDSLASGRYTFWLDAGGRPVAGLLVAEQGPREGEAGRFDCNLIWRPAADGEVRADVFPVAWARLAALASEGCRAVTMSVDGRDTDWRARLEAVGFRHEPGEDMVQMWQHPGAPPAPRPLPAGMWFDDDRSRPPERPHHLVKRNGERIAERLRECSLYRPELDLCVRTEAGEVAAYCLCWVDPINGVGLFEPVRTEAAFQRRGIGRALLTKGLRRMMAAGAGLIKVASMSGNGAARGLYASVGFAEAFPTLQYLR